MFLRERVVLTHVSGEPAQRALDDITSFLDGYMGDDVHHAHGLAPNYSGRRLSLLEDVIFPVAQRAFCQAAAISWTSAQHPILLVLRL